MINLNLCDSIMYVILIHLQGVGATELTLDGVSGVGSEMERIHIAEKNKAMAAKLKVYNILHIISVSYLQFYIIRHAVNPP